MDSIILVLLQVGTVSSLQLKTFFPRPLLPYFPQGQEKVGSWV